MESKSSRKVILIIVVILLVGSAAAFFWFNNQRENGVQFGSSGIQKSLTAGCGNSLCEEGETFSSCPMDCYNPESSGPELAKLALTSSDFPPPHQGTTPNEKTSWVKFFDQLVDESYVWPSLQNKGALAIYETITQLTGPNDLSWYQWGRLEQYILVFPSDKISKAFDESLSMDFLSKISAQEREKISFQELPDPAVGEKSKALKLKFGVGDENGRTVKYIIVFVKKGFLEFLMFSGEKYEYQVFPPLARKAAEKIQ
ncbi:MAG: hypothetical protein A3B30_04565 [Candidatus Komeilibacteria bacterium RIFCSPLOWO2_01_FULL_52_15]|nr:MAG: hypothetical protein A3B30_04565 [Candidatus Komeilibacteria bacterium RIFCSPLOWO2_01_FULL_52_15]